MELPPNFPELYRHLDLHTGEDKEPDDENGIYNQELLSHIRWFIHERIAIWQRKTEGVPPPFTSDPVLSQYRFCNILRECDKQTIEFHTLLNPLRDDMALWMLNMFYARLVARTTTIKSTGLLTFDAKHNEKVFKTLTCLPTPKYGNPYVFPISVIQRSKTPTRETFITQYLPSVMQKIVNEIMQWKYSSVFDGVEKILPIFRYNLKFLWTEVLIDTAYQFPLYLDLYKRFPTGPGALPTLRRIAPSEDPSVLVALLADMHTKIDITYKNKPIRLSAENWEGIACEYRKYTNLTNGHGRKRLYK